MHHAILFAATAILVFFGWHLVRQFQGAAIARRQAEQDEQVQPR